MGRRGERRAPSQSNVILVAAYLDAPQRGKAINCMSDTWKLDKCNRFMLGRNQTEGATLLRGIF